MPVLPKNLAAIYRDQLACLQIALSGPDHTEALEAARRLIDRIVINPGSDPDGPPDIELIGDLTAMLTVGGLKAQHARDGAASAPVFDLFNSSVKEGLRT